MGFGKSQTEHSKTWKLQSEIRNQNEKKRDGRSEEEMAVGWRSKGGMSVSSPLIAYQIAFRLSNIIKRYNSAADGVRVYAARSRPPTEGAHKLIKASRAFQ